MNSDNHKRSSKGFGKTVSMKGGCMTVVCIAYITTSASLNVLACYHMCRRIC